MTWPPNPDQTSDTPPALREHIDALIESGVVFVARPDNDRFTVANLRLPTHPGAARMTGTTDNDEPMRDRVAATIAKAQDADYWVDEIREWEARADWERETYADSLPSMAYEDRSAFLRAADDVLALLAERAAK